MTDLKTLIQEALNELESRDIMSATPLVVVVEPPEIYPLLILSDEKERHWTIFMNLCKVFGLVVWVEVFSYKREAIVACVQLMTRHTFSPTLLAEIRIEDNNVFINMSEEHEEYFEILCSFLKRLGLVKTAEIIEQHLTSRE